MEEDPLSIKKAVSGLVNPKNTIKTAIFSFHGAMVFLLILGGISAFNWLFPKKTNNTQKQTSTVTFGKDSGVHDVTIVNQQQQDVKKKNVGIELGASSDDAELLFVKYVNDNLSVAVGPRWTYDKDSDGNNVLPVVRVKYDFN